MKSISLRFAEKYAPSCGTIQAHQDVINSHGFVWYGKFGNAPKDSVMEQILCQENPKILLIHSGGTERYWATITEFTKEIPQREFMPEYYQTILDRMKSWFKVIAFEKAEKDVMAHCIVSSSGNSLTSASIHSMSPYFVIEYKRTSIEGIL